MRPVVAACALALTACAMPEPVPHRNPAPALAAPAPVARPAPRPARRPAPPPAGEGVALWRVAADGVSGCADPAALRELRATEDGDTAQLRRIAALRAAGGCVTIFRGQRWRLLESAGDVLRLSPVDGGPGPLHFWRDEVTEERGG